MEKNDFELLCDEMKKDNERRKVVRSENPIICAKCLVNKCANGDLNKLLKIKAEASGMTYLQFVSGIISWLSVFIASGTFIINLFEKLYKKLFGTSEVVDCVASVAFWALLFLLIILIIAAVGLKVFRNVNKYGKYIIVAIEELEKEYKQRESLKENKTEYLINIEIEVPENHLKRGRKRNRKG